MSKLMLARVGCTEHRGLFAEFVIEGRLFGEILVGIINVAIGARVTEVELQQVVFPCEYFLSYLEAPPYQVGTNSDDRTYNKDDPQ
jgi:hypothetical protein